MVLLVSGSHVTYTFTDPVDDPRRLEKRAGLFLVLEQRAGSTRLLDVDEAAHVQSSILTHPHRACWLQHGRGRLAYSAAYLAWTSAAVRQVVVADIRSTNEVRCQP